MLFYKKGFVFNEFHMSIYKSNYLKYLNFRENSAKWFITMFAFFILPLSISCFLLLSAFKDNLSNFNNIYTDIRFYLVFLFITPPNLCALKMKFESFFSAANRRSVQISSNKNTYKRDLEKTYSGLKSLISFSYFQYPVILLTPYVFEIISLHLPGGFK